VIKSFRCYDTERTFSGNCPKRFRHFRSQAERKLVMVHSAAEIREDVRRYVPL